MAIAAGVAGIFSIFAGILESVFDNWVETFRVWDDLSTQDKVGSILSMIFLGCAITVDNTRNNADFRKTDLEIEANQAEELIRRNVEARSQAGREILSSEERAIQAVGALGSRQWEIVGRLDGSNLVQSDENGVQNLVEAEVNQLRRELLRLQNIQRLISMLVRGKSRIREIVAKVTT